MHKDLVVWEKTKELVKMTYEIARFLPKPENYALGLQMKRASISVLSNIAEGAARSTTKDYCKYLYIALGSVCELEAQYEACIFLNFCEKNPAYEDKINHVGRLLNRQIKSLKLKIPR